MDTVILLDLDFFVKPTYFGSFFGIKDWNSYEDFKAKSERWLDSDTFLNKIKMKDPIRGCVVLENKQVIFNLKKMFDTGYLERGNTQILMFDAHPNTYYWFPQGDIDKWSLSNFDSFDSTFAFFKEGMTDKIIWVAPDYMDGSVFKKHFENVKHYREQNMINIYSSKQFQTIVKLVKWGEFIQRPKNYQIKFFGLVTNPRMVNHSQEELQNLTSMIKQY